MAFHIVKIYSHSQQFIISQNSQKYYERIEHMVQINIKTYLVVLPGEYEVDNSGL